MPIDEKAIVDACRAFTVNTLWQTPDSKNMSDIVNTDQSKNLTQEYFEEALSHVEFVESEGRDPNLVARAALYLPDVPAILPMKKARGAAG